MTFAIQKLNNVLVVCRVQGGHNFHNDAIIAGPFASHVAAMQALADLRGSDCLRAA